MRKLIPIKSVYLRLLGENKNGGDIMILIVKGGPNSPLFGLLAVKSEWDITCFNIEDLVTVLKEKKVSLGEILIFNESARFTAEEIDGLLSLDPIRSKMLEKEKKDLKS